MLISFWEPGIPKEGCIRLLKLSNPGRILGVKIHTHSPVEQIITRDGKAIGLMINGKAHHADIILSGADYHHTETLLDQKDRVYSEKYWSKNFCAFSPAFYVGFDQKLSNLTHHNLFLINPLMHTL